MSPDLKTLLHESAPEPSDGPHLDDLRRRAGRRRAVRLGSLGAAGVALMVAATVLVLSQPTELPVPDVVNPQPSDLPSSVIAPSPAPSSSGEGQDASSWIPPRLDVVGVAGGDVRGTSIVRRHPDGQETVIAEIQSTEESISSLDVTIRGDSFLGVYTSSIGESDELWWWTARTDGGAAMTQARLPDELQARHRGGVSEIGWPQPVLSETGVLAYVEAQGSAPEYGGDGYVSTLRLIPFDAELAPTRPVSIGLPRWEQFLVAHDLRSCPGQNEELCLFTIDALLREFRITTDGALRLEETPTSLEPTSESPGWEPMGIETLDVASTTTQDGQIRRWALSAPREWKIQDVDNPTLETVFELPFASPADHLRWFDVHETTAVVVTSTRVLIVDLETGRMANGPPSLANLHDAVLVGVEPPEFGSTPSAAPGQETPTGARAAADAFVAAWIDQEWDGVEASPEAISYAQSQPIDDTPWVCRSPRDDGVVQCDRPYMGGPNILYILLEETEVGSWRVWWASIGHA